MSKIKHESEIKVAWMLYEVERKKAQEKLDVSVYKYFKAKKKRAKAVRK